jgi:hypothetical protein
MKNAPTNKDLLTGILIICRTMPNNTRLLVIVKCKAQIDWVPI